MAAATFEMRVLQEAAFHRKLFFFVGSIVLIRRISTELGAHPMHLSFTITHTIAKAAITTKTQGHAQ